MVMFYRASNIYRFRFKFYNVRMKKLVIITGASSGMGAEFARQLADEYTAKGENAEFWLIARTQDKLEVIGQDIKRDGITVRLFPMDVKGMEGVRKLAMHLGVEGEMGEYSVDVLVNNAGFGTYGTFEDTNMMRQLDMIDLNCTALTGICGICLPHMSSGSRIINVASLASYLPLGNFAVYAATKAYVLSFTLSLRAEVQDRGICVTALCPGPVTTNFANVASNGARKEVRHGLSAQKTVAHCLRCSKKGKPVAIMSFSWKFKAFMSRFVSRTMGARFTFLYCKRPSQPVEEDDIL